MVKESLVNGIRQVLESLQREGKDFNFAALVPVYPGLPSTSYILLLDGMWLQQIPSFVATKAIIKRLFEVIDDPEIRKKITGINVWQKSHSFQPGIEAEILIDDDKISRYFNYMPTTSFSGSLLGNA